LQHEFNQRFDWHQKDETSAKRKAHEITSVPYIEMGMGIGTTEWHLVQNLTCVAACDIYKCVIEYY
jgi:hypothetical protein